MNEVNNEKELLDIYLHVFLLSTCELLFVFGLRCTAQPVRRHRWYEALRRAVASVAKESRQLSATKNKNGERGLCFQPRSSSPGSDGVFCCSTTQPRDKNAKGRTTSGGLSQIATKKTDKKHLQNQNHQDSVMSLSHAASDVTQSRHIDRET